MQRRTELILRLPNLSAEQAAQITAALEPLARRAGGRLSAIERDQYSDYALHVSRRRIV